MVFFLFLFFFNYILILILINLLLQRCFCVLQNRAGFISMHIFWLSIFAFFMSTLFRTMLILKDFFLIFSHII